MQKKTAGVLKIVWALVVCALVAVASILLHDYLGESRAGGGGTGRQPDADPVALQSASLFFATADAEGLSPELREIREGRNTLETMKVVLHELIRGPAGTLSPTLPPTATVEALYMLPNGLLVVDFGQSIQTDHPGGSAAELLSVYSIVNTLTTNFKSVKQVKLLVEGDEIETLAGHVDTSEALAADGRWIKRYLRGSDSASPVAPGRIAR
jgi:hypothetical protein